MGDKITQAITQEIHKINIELVPIVKELTPLHATHTGRKYIHLPAIEDLDRRIDKILKEFKEGHGTAELKQEFKILISHIDDLYVENQQVKDLIKKLRRIAYPEFIQEPIQIIDDYLGANQIVEQMMEKYDEKDFLHYPTTSFFPRPLFLTFDGPKRSQERELINAENYLNEIRTHVEEYLKKRGYFSNLSFKTADDYLKGLGIVADIEAHERRRPTFDEYYEELPRDLTDPKNISHIHNRGKELRNWPKT